MGNKPDNEQQKPENNDEKPVTENHDAELAGTEETGTSSGGATRQPWPKRWWHWATTHKKISIPVAIVLVLAVLAALPFTRYAITGLFLKQTFTVAVVDAETGKPVSSATVSFNGRPERATTNGEGIASIKTKVGYATLAVDKKYYEGASHDVTVLIKKPESPFKVELKATGRAVPITVLNNINQKPAANVTIKASDEDTEAKTDEDGKATLVVPADKQEVKISLSGEGFNNAEATVTVTADDNAANTFHVTPNGKLYFLSNASGNIDLVKSNLDGTERQTVLAGTGKEERNNTVLLASRDWKYIALLSKRDGGEYAKLFLIEAAANDKVTVMDEGEATFSVYGWSGDRFVYAVTRDKFKAWEPKRQAIKSYHAPGKKITTLAETTAEGDSANYAYETFTNSPAYVLDKEIVFPKAWYGSCSNYTSCLSPKINGKQASLHSVNADGSQKKTIKTYPTNTYIETSTGDFGEIYIVAYDTSGGGGTSKVEEYHDGKITASDLTQSELNSKSYPRYAVSPSGNKTLWSEYRDGKNVFFVGDANGENGKDIGRSEDFLVYGWFSDDYILLTKKNSEMHIMPAGELEGGVEKSLKVSDYYKPQNYYNSGFGYGYGG